MLEDDDRGNGPSGESCSQRDASLFLGLGQDAVSHGLKPMLRVVREDTELN